VIGYSAIGNGSNSVTLGNSSITKTVLGGDNNKLLFGAGKDASIYYDGTNLVVNPKEVGAGYLKVDGQILATDKVMFTQTDGNEYIDSLADGYMDYGATTAHRFLADVKLTADNRKLYFGTGDDASIYYDGTNLVINPKEVGSGILDVLGTLQTDGYNSADGTAGATADVATLAPDGTTTRTLHFKNGLYTGYTDS